MWERRFRLHVMSGTCRLGTFCRVWDNRKFTISVIRTVLEQCILRAQLGLRASELQFSHVMLQFRARPHKCWWLTLETSKETPTSPLPVHPTLSHCPHSCHCRLPVLPSQYDLHGLIDIAYQPTTQSLRRGKTSVGSKRTYRAISPASKQCPWGTHDELQGGAMVIDSMVSRIKVPLHDLPMCLGRLTSHSLS